MSKYILIFFCIIFSTSFSSCTETSVQKEKSKEIQTSDYIQIGNQKWMAKNLDVSVFKNGEVIPQAKSNRELQYANDNLLPVWCYYNFDSANGSIYGKLYNWYAVNDSRGIAPEGWHVPNIVEWSTLIDNLGGEEIAGFNMKDTIGWVTQKLDHMGSPIPPKNGNGSNSSGFKALPGGFNDFGMNILANWWTSSESGSNTARKIQIFADNNRVERYDEYKESVLSVRCIKK
jgi:uncharacterized protein (TIGR02145 family)